MAKCHNCNIEILDVSEYCPLCRNVLEKDETLENMYPNGHISMRKLNLFARIYLFSIIMIEAVLVLLNFVLATKIWWSAITGLGLMYSYLVLRYAIIGKSGHRIKAFVLILLGILSALAIDFVIGYRGWSVDYMLPAGILMMDAVILICIFINRRSWQSYIMWLIFMLICSLLPVTLFMNQFVNHWYLAFAPAFFTTAILLGVLIIGGDRALDEIRRRFHM